MLKFHEMYRRIEEMYESFTQENSQDWGLYCPLQEQEMFLPIAVVLVSKSTSCPLSCPPPPWGGGSAYDQLCALLFPSLLVSPFFSCPVAFVSTASYSVLGQLSDARWPSSARPCPSSLRRGNSGKAVPLHYSCSPAAARGSSGGTAVTADTEAVAQFIDLLVLGLQSDYFKRAASERVIFLNCILPQTYFFLHVLISIKLLRTEGAHMHSKSIWPTLIVFLLPLIISSISLCSWYVWSLKLFVANSFLHRVSHGTFQTAAITTIQLNCN